MQKYLPTTFIFFIFLICPCVTITLTCCRIMMTSSKGTISALLAFVGKSPVTGEFPSQRLVTRSFDVFVDLRLNKRLDKQSKCRWFQSPSRSIWCHCNNEYANSITQCQLNRPSIKDNTVCGLWGSVWQEGNYFRQSIHLYVFGNPDI